MCWLFTSYLDAGEHLFRREEQRVMREGWKIPEIFDGDLMEC